MPDVAAARALAGTAASELEALLARRRDTWSVLLKLPADVALLRGTEDAAGL